MKGIRSDAHGLQAFIKVRGRFYSKRFPHQTPAAELKRWREARKVGIVEDTLFPAVDARASSFREDAAMYLATLGPMPSKRDRVRDIRAWMAVFGSKPRSAITAYDIRSHLDTLRQTHSGSSCNKRRTALMSLYTTLDGRSGRNPVRDVPKYEESDPEPRALTFWIAYRLLALMRPSKTRARLRVMLWTGWPHVQLMRLTPAHVDVAAGRAYLTPRRKGKGRRGVTLPLLPGAVIALKDFAARDCWGPFQTSAMYRLFAHALAELNARRARFDHPPIVARPYDFRHSFGTLIATLSTDDRALQELMMHATPQQTRRYTEAATHARVAATVTKVASAVARPPATQKQA